MFSLLDVAQVLGALYVGAGILLFGLMTVVTSASLRTKVIMSAVWPLVVNSIVLRAANVQKLSKETDRYMPYMIAILHNRYLNEEQKDRLRKGVHNSIKNNIFPPVVISGDGYETSLEAIGIEPEKPQ